MDRTVLSEKLKVEFDGPQSSDYAAILGVGVACNHTLKNKVYYEACIEWKNLKGTSFGIRFSNQPNFFGV